MRDIEAKLLDLHGLKVSPDLISRVTDAVLDEVRDWRVRDWQGRALERTYQIVIFDVRRRGATGSSPRATRVKICNADSRTVKNKSV